MELSIFLNQLDNLYQRYGYEFKKKQSSEFARVYTLSKGVYYGADIVELIPNEIEINKIFEQISKAGYACRTRKYQNIKNAEESLFKSFFHSDSLKERLINKYKSFAYSQEQLLRLEYKYILVPFMVDDETPGSKLNILESITNKLDREGPELLIIEAAAGFGKTCTSFEIINHLSKNRPGKSPIFTELSRDRKASKFKYILQDVILTEFHSLLNEELVIHEVQSGRIPLVIDGFDELLSKEQDKAGKDDFEQVETMLSTIGDLLQGNAKIILTGRKTAIFSGDSFKDWINESPNEFSVTRFLITPPKLEDWLDEQKLSIIYQKKIPIRDISNPVLLAFLRSLTIEKFVEVANNPEKIVERYFETILDREQVRQELRLEPKLQLEVFKSLARRMMEFDITADTKEWIKLLIEEQNRPLLETVRKSYPLAQRPTTEELTNTLSNHALLDRKGGDDKIGFINDFIFGTLIAEAILNIEEDDLKDISNHMYELAVTSFQFQTTTRKTRLATIIDRLDKFSNQEKLVYEYLLTNNVKNNFVEAAFSELTITDQNFNNDLQFKKCVFSNCTFKNVTFNSLCFFETSFVNCNFIECKIEHEMELGDITERILFIGGTDYESGFIKRYQNFRNLNAGQNHDEDVKTSLLSKFFQVGSQRPRMKKMSYLINEFASSDRSKVSNEIEELKKSGYLKTNGDNTYLTDEGIGYAISIIY